MISSHVLDEVERFGSRVLVIAQGRLAAEGDFHAIRDLMDDRPAPAAARDRPARPPGRRPARGRAWCRAPRRGRDGTGVEVETTDVHRFRRAVAVVARTAALPLPSWFPSTTTSTASSATWWAGDVVIATVYRLVARAALATRGGSPVLLGLLGARRRRRGPRGRASATCPTGLEAGADLVNAFGLSLYVPVVTLVFASAALGDPAEDGTPRVPVAAAGGPLADRGRRRGWPPLTVDAAARGRAGDAHRRWPPGAAPTWWPGTLVVGTLAVIAYAGIFCYLGLRVRRALVWGLAYVLLWEGFVAVAGRNAAAARRACLHPLDPLLTPSGVELHLGDVAPCAPR